LRARLAGSARLALEIVGQARFPFRPIEAIRCVQSRRVRAMVSHAWRTVPFYRDAMRRLGLTPTDFVSADDLARLPAIGRSDLQRDPERFRSEAFASAELLELRSGGSSGEPVAVWHDLGSVRANAAHGERDRSVWAGRLVPRRRYREAVIGLLEGADVSVPRFLRRGVVVPAREEVERRYVSAVAPIAATLDDLHAFRPHVIRAYGSFLEMLLAHVHACGAEFPRPALVTYSSDELCDEARRYVERELGVPVLATYEAIEAFKIGFECGHRTGYHLNVDLYPLRVEDGSREVIVSNLVNRATVLLNYRIGDLATLSPDRCPCGRTLPLMSRLDGRRDGVLRRADGSPLLPMTASLVFVREPGVWQFQIREVAPLRLEVRIVAAPACDRAAAAARIAAALARELGDGAQVRVDVVDRIERTAGAKVRRIIAYPQQSGAGFAAWPRA
jgi:phenylacetate-CoA ligase